MPATNAGVPRVPDPPKDWDPGFMREFTRTITNWIIRATAESQEELAEDAITTVTANYSVGLNDGTILVDTTAGNVTITLPAAATCLGRIFHVKRITAGAHTLTLGSVSGVIDGSATKAMAAQWALYSVRSNGTAYYIMSQI